MRVKIPKKKFDDLPLVYPNDMEYMTAAKINAKMKKAFTIGAHSTTARFYWFKKFFTILLAKGVFINRVDALMSYFPKYKTWIKNHSINKIKL
jgi:hypothetical protein